MAKEELLEFDGVVTEVLPDGNFRVKLDNDHGHQGKQRRNGQNHAPAVPANPDNIATVGFMRKPESRGHMTGDASRNSR